MTDAVLVQDGEALQKEDGGQVLLESSTTLTHYEHLTIGTGGIKSKFLKTKWPVVKGTTAGTTSQTGRVMNLVAQSSKVSNREKIGL